MSRTTDWVLELEEAGLIDDNSYEYIDDGIMMFSLEKIEEDLVNKSVPLEEDCDIITSNS